MDATPFRSSSACSRHARTAAEAWSFAGSDGGVFRTVPTDPLAADYPFEARWTDSNQIYFVGCSRSEWRDNFSTIARLNPATGELLRLEAHPHA